MIHLFLVVFFGFKQDAVSAEDLGTVFSCLPTHMRMVLDLAKNPDLEPEEMHLNDPSCKATEFNDTFVLFEIQLDGCGTTRDGSNPDYLRFSNTAHWEPPGHPITYKKAFKAQITCRYSRHGTVSAWFVAEPPTVPKDLGTVFSCLPTHMRMVLDLTKNPDLEPEEMHLNDPSCNATEFNDNFVLFEIPLDGCGTTRDGSNPDYLLFSNTAHWEPPGHPITHTKAFKAQITCRYSRDGIVLVWFVPETEEPPTVPKVDITRNTSAFVNVTEGERITINCSIPGTDKPSWSRRDGKELITKTRKVEGVLLQIANISVADTGIYVCKHGKDTHTIWIQVLVELDVEMELVVENYEFTEDLKNKSSPIYKETEKNFTTEMDKVHRGVTPGYVRTEVLNFTKGSVKVDFRIIIVLVTNDPENATDLPDVKAKTAQRVVVKAKTGFVERLQVKQVIVKTVPLEPANVEIFGIDSDELSVRWSPSEDADSFEIQKYVVQHREFSDKVYISASQPASDDKTQYTFRIQPLEAETTYMVRVGAVNQYGHNYNDESAHKTEATPFAWWIIVVVVLVILLVLVILVVLILYKRKRDRERKEQQQGSRFNALELDARSNAVAVYEDKNVKGLAYSYSNDAYKPSEVNWEEIPYHNLKLLDELGSGAFGVVYKGELLQDNGNVMPCAVKALKPSATSEEIRDLYNELEIMVNVGYHPNLVNLIGACTEDGHLLVVLEIAENGSLLEFLKKSRPTDQSYENINSGLTEEMKTRIATDVARGMAHLANCRCIHRDLAARNVLLGKDYVAKVSDYGMARDVYEQLMYKKETQGKLPVKWMAIESLETYIFTIESDVWAYGVLLWEIESGGLKPYAGLNTTELIAQLKKGYRLEKPNGCSEEMYQIMRSCWNPNPSARPTFGQLLIQMQSKTET